MTQSSGSFSFRLVSPEAEVMNAPALEVVVPGSEGEFGVRVGHMALVSTLRPGVVTVHAEHDPNPVRYFIAGGFANVNASSCTVLAETAIDVLQLDAASVQADIDGLTARLAQPNDDVIAAQIRAELDIARARLSAARLRAAA